MVHQSSKKCVRVCIIDELEFLVYNGVDDTGVCDAGAFYYVYWCSSGKKLKIPMARIVWVSEEYEHEEQAE